MRAGLTRASLGGLGLAPREFWDLTPAELALMLGIEPGRGGGMNRAGLEALMARFPDAPAGGG
nr:phage tail assembly chaperone [Paracoccus sanguinis]